MTKLVADVDYHKREKEQVIERTYVSQSESLSKYRARTSATVDKLKTTIKEQDHLIRGTQEIAEDMAVEYSSLKRSAKAKEVELTKAANSRLSSLKQSRERESALRESLDSAKETYSDELATAHATVDRQAGIICVLKDELDHAKKEIHVRSTPKFTIHLKHH